jgi:hypothetical protein
MLFRKFCIFKLLYFQLFHCSVCRCTAFSTSHYVLTLFLLIVVCLLFLFHILLVETVDGIHFNHLSYLFKSANKIKIKGWECVRHVCRM